jgi:hypothetical protein
LEAEYDPRITQWYVAFRTNNSGFRWQRFLKKGFGHVFAFTFDSGAKRWIMFDPGWDGITLRAYRSIDFRKKLAGWSNNHTVLLCDLQKNKITKPLILTCSTEIAHLLGINKFFLTPWGLFCALRKCGGKYSFDNSGNRERKNG